MCKAGDKVAVLDDELEGKVISVEGNMMKIETSEGFLLEFHKSEIIKIEDADPEELFNGAETSSEAIQEKEAYKKPKSQRVKPKERNLPPMEVDLHIHKLTNSSKGMSNFDMLNLQIDTVKRQLEFAMKKRIQKIVFIHGVGEGVLKAELDFLLGRYENLKFYDADFQKYGVGATEVYIFQNNY